MATRADVQAEFDILRSKMAKRDAPESAGTDPHAEAAQTRATPGTEADPAAGEADADVTQADVQSELERLLSHLGVSEDELQDLTTQFWQELDTLPHKKPLLTAIGAFGLGFVLGRLTK
ncbi:MAG: hypothetical protein AAGA28_04670 [Pseudomonadota bacterium]